MWRDGVDLFVKFLKSNEERQLIIIDE